MLRLTTVIITKKKNEWVDFDEGEMKEAFSHALDNSTKICRSIFSRRSGFLSEWRLGFQLYSGDHGKGPSEI